MWLLCLGITANAGGVGLPAHPIVAIAVVTECAQLLPISIQGIGVREATLGGPGRRWAQRRLPHARPTTPCIFC
jgi:hypothetical protein